MTEETIVNEERDEQISLPEDQPPKYEDLFPDPARN